MLNKNGQYEIPPIFILIKYSTNYFTLLLAGVRGTMIIASKRATSKTVIMIFFIK